MRINPGGASIELLTWAAIAASNATAAPSASPPKKDRDTESAAALLMSFANSDQRYCWWLLPSLDCSCADLERPWPRMSNRNTVRPSFPGSKMLPIPLASSESQQPPRPCDQTSNWIRCYRTIGVPNVPQFHKLFQCSKTCMESYCQTQRLIRVSETFLLEADSDVKIFKFGTVQRISNSTTKIDAVLHTICTVTAWKNRLDLNHILNILNLPKTHCPCWGSEWIWELWRFLYLFVSCYGHRYSKQGTSAGDELNTEIPPKLAARVSTWSEQVAPKRKKFKRNGLSTKVAKD